MKFFAAIMWALYALLFWRFGGNRMAGPRRWWLVGAVGAAILSLSYLLDRPLYMRLLGDAFLYFALGALTAGWVREGRRIKALRRENDAHFRTFVTEQVGKWACPRCNTRDLRLIDVDTVTVECAECRWVSDPLPEWARPGR